MRLTPHCITPLDSTFSGLERWPSCLYVRFTRLVWPSAHDNPNRPARDRILREFYPSVMSYGKWLKPALLAVICSNIAIVLLFSYQSIIHTRMHAGKQLSLSRFLHSLALPSHSILTSEAPRRYHTLFYSLASSSGRCPCLSMYMHFHPSSANPFALLFIATFGSHSTHLFVL